MLIWQWRKTKREERHAVVFFGEGEEEVGGQGSESYDSKKAWSSKVAKVGAKTFYRAKTLCHYTFPLNFVHL